VNSRLMMLKRVAKLYELVEKMHSMALSQATASVNEMEAAIAKQREQVHEAALQAREALATGNSQQWTFARAQQIVGTVRKQKLDVVRLQRQVVIEHARLAHSASCIMHEQIKSVVRRSETASESVEEKRFQASIDDQFHSRLRWSQHRQEYL
jgi:hypothetical protein